MTTLDSESFERLLDWLDPNREVAGRKYVQMRERLIRFFTLRGESEAEDLADKVVDRVAKKANELSKSYEGDPARYFYRVAHFVSLEHQRKRERESITSVTPIPALPVDDIEKEFSCMEKCLDQLPSDVRYTVLSYYQLEKKAMVDHRKELANNLGLELNALRAKVHRIRQQLITCVKRCLESSGNT